MAVYSRRLKRGARWRFQRVIKGQELRSLYIYPAKQAAEMAEAKAVAEYLGSGRLPIDPPEIPADSCPTVLELLNDRVSWVELHRSKAYARDHKYCFRRVLKRTPEWADMPATAITVEMVEDWAERWAAPPKGRLAIELMVGSGVRPSEAVVLQWVDVQVDQEPCSVVLFTRKKWGGSLTPRWVPITLELASRLRSWRKQNPETHYVFQQTTAARDGEPLPNTYSWARRVQEKACDAAGVARFSLHSWRHLYASRLARAGKSLPTIQALLGHESATTTNGTFARF